mmetsp:Transcript_31044/g.72087  ORF Transcript_31044/g.72087 Transcript_31044/m.72087 type:complete len:294 (+) Transcript_31044:90-971(+)
MWRWAAPCSAVRRHAHGHLQSHLRRAATPVTGATPPLVLALDLDETLLRPKIPAVAEHRRRRLALVDFEVNLEINGGTLCQVSLRPGLTEFFQWVRGRRTEGVLSGPWVFAQGASVYVEAVMQKLDPTGDIFEDRVFTKESCTTLKTPGYVLKDLTSLAAAASKEGTRCQVSQVILVDNNAVSAILHPRNTLLVRDWRGDGRADAELRRITTSLDSLITDMRHGDHGLEPGDYAGLLAQRTPRLLAFREELEALHKFLDTEPSRGQLKQRLTRAWDLSCTSKQKLLGLAEGEH